MSTGQVLGLVAGLAAALLFGLAAVAQAHAVRRFDTTPSDLVGFVLRSVRDPWTLGVVAAILLSATTRPRAVWISVDAARAPMSRSADSD